MAALALGSLAYPASLAARLTEQGAILSDRAGAFVFVSLGFVIAAGLEYRATTQRRFEPRLWTSCVDLLQGVFGRWRSVVAPVFLILIMVGGIALSFPVWARLPGPYLVSADPRSVEPQSIAAAEWAARHLGRDNRFVVDRVNRVILGTIGGQHPVTASFDQVRVRNVFFSPTLGEQEIKTLADGAIDFVLADRRLSSNLPVVGVYYEKGEIATGRHTVPLSPDALDKYDGVDGLSRLFDSGDIQVYDVRNIVR
jgi:hypothetical protein